MRICVYSIAKNEEKFVQRFYEAAKGADLILIADTGSTDGTIETIKRWQAISSTPVSLYQIHVAPWRFDLARNAALALVPADIDVCVSLDLDEELQPGWRQEIERVWKLGETTRLGYMFDWGVGIKFLYEKIHARNGYRWHHPCHEYPMPDGRITEKFAETSMLLVIHKPDSTKSRGSYLDLLRVSIEEDPNCPRNAFYYARELSFHNQFEESIKECDRYLTLPRATWVNERCYAYRTKGRCYSSLGDLQKAEQAFYMAASEAPNTREPWVELATLMYKQSRWHECFAFGMRALAIGNDQREFVYTVDPEVWTWKPHDMVAIAAHWLGMKDLAIEHGKLAVAAAPNDLRLSANVTFYERGK